MLRALRHGTARAWARAASAGAAPAYPTRPGADVVARAEQYVVDAIATAGPKWADAYGRDWMLQTWRHVTHRAEEQRPEPPEASPKGGAGDAGGAAAANGEGADWRQKWDSDELSKRYTALEDTLREQAEGEYWSNLLLELADAWQRTDAWLSANAPDVYARTSAESRAAFIDACVYRWPDSTSPAYTSLVFRDPNLVLASFTSVAADAPPNTPVRDLVYTGNTALADKAIQERIVDRGHRVVAFYTQGNGDLLALATGEDVILLHTRHFDWQSEQLSKLWGDPQVQKVSVTLGDQRTPKALLMAERKAVFDLSALYIQHAEEATRKPPTFDELLRLYWGADLRPADGKAVRSGSWANRWLTPEQVAAARQDVELVLGLLWKQYPDGSIPVKEPEAKPAAEGEAGAAEDAEQK